MTTLSLVASATEQQTWRRPIDETWPAAARVEWRDAAGQINIELLSREDIPSNSRWLPRQPMPVLLQVTDEEVWASIPGLDEHAVGQSRSEAKQTLWSVLVGYFESLNRRRGRLSERLQADFNYLVTYLEPRDALTN